MQTRLVRPLEQDWQVMLDEVARARGWPSSREPARLGAIVRELSEAYNDARSAPQSLLAARLGFSFARDVPKGAGAARELIETGLLALEEGRPLRVLDLGAGLGATTWGAVRALEAAGARGSVEVTWVDDDAAALEVALSIAKGREGRASITVQPRTREGDARAGVSGRFDLVLLGQVLSELDPGARDKAAAHTAWLGKLLASSLEPQGSLVIVEPALRDRTRHLHAVRDALLAGGEAHVFAPCLHADRCPALTREGDWCHEDLDVDLPPWLVPVARAAGLRWQRLTFSYLVLRRDGASLGHYLPRSGARLRAVSELIASKGKTEAFLCGNLDGQRGVRVRAMRLDRDQSAVNRDWGELERGDLLRLDPPPEPGPSPRIGRNTGVDRATPRALEVDCGPSCR